MPVSAIVLDLDGVVVDTEEVWDRERRAYVDAHGGTWTEKATRKMQGMSSAEWAGYLRDKLGADGEVGEISSAVAAGVVAEIERELPLLPGAIRAINALANAFPLALASSANREVIDAVLDGAGITARFGATVSSEEVPRGKPAPDVYLEAARRLGVDLGGVRGGRGLLERAAIGASRRAWSSSRRPTTRSRRPPTRWRWPRSWSTGSRTSRRSW